MRRETRAAPSCDGVNLNLVNIWLKVHSKWVFRKLSGGNLNSKKTRLVGGTSGDQTGPVARSIAMNATAARLAGKVLDEENGLSLEPEGRRILRHALNISDVQYIYIGHPIGSMR